MASYTAFLSGLRPGAALPDTNDVWGFQVTADCLMITEDNLVFTPWGDPGSWWAAWAPLSSTSTIETGDDVASLRTKALENIYMQYTNISSTNDTINFVWIDNT